MNILRYANPGHIYEEVVITEKMKRWATHKASVHKCGDRYVEKMGDGGRDNIYVGYLGEAIFWSTYPMAKHVNVSDHDFLLWKRMWEIKGYWSNFPPQPDYFGLVPAEAAERVNIDASYFFICIDTDKDIAWKIGTITNRRFKEISTFKKKGELQEGGRFTYKVDDYEIRLKQLDHTFSECKP